MAPYIRIGETYRGVWPFVASDLARVAILVVFPIITLFVVRLW
jgi:TRAP-type C4-dicarboxylate transport system permease large subunit